MLLLGFFRDLTGQLFWFMIQTITIYLHMKTDMLKLCWYVKTDTSSSLFVGYYSEKLPCCTLSFCLDMLNGHNWRCCSGFGHGKGQPFGLVYKIWYEIALCCLFCKSFQPNNSKYKKRKNHVKCIMQCMEYNTNANEENDVTKWQLFSYIYWGGKIHFVSFLSYVMFFSAPLSNE